MESTFKDNHHLQKGFMTGVLRIAKSGYLSGLNNVEEYNMADTRFSKFYGFNQSEVSKIFEIYKIEDSNLKDRIKKYYNGYKCFD